MFGMSGKGHGEAQYTCLNNIMVTMRGDISVTQCADEALHALAGGRQENLTF
jgi:hypothetical protein